MPPNGPKILIIDDLPTMRQMIRNILAGFGFASFVEAQDGQEALDTLEQDPGSIRLILCDNKMPRMDGYELLTKLRADPRFASLPFILVTAEGDEELIIRSLKAGADSYIIKPLSPDDLRQQLIELKLLKE